MCPSFLQFVRSVKAAIHPRHSERRGNNIRTPPITCLLLSLCLIFTYYLTLQDNM